ncbi:MAG: 30S ribosome-binding factor RbfA [Terriglobales bacterium]
MPHRPERLAETIRDELTELIEGELADPRVGLATVSEVSLEPPLRMARIYVAVAGDEEEQLRTLEGLLAARSFLRAELGHRLHLRRVPELRFELDRSREYSARLEELLQRSRKRTAAQLRKKGELNV